MIPMFHHLLGSLLVPDALFGSNLNLPARTSPRRTAGPPTHHHLTKVPSPLWSPMANMLHML
jgi:hypothetical protein